MRGRGISYSTGAFTPGAGAVDPFDIEVVKRDMRVIRNDLHCNAVRIIGADPDRLEAAARVAADEGLEVWYCPFPIDYSFDEMIPLMEVCAERAEQLRVDGAGVVFVTGAELMLLARGFIPGEKLEERIAALSNPGPLRDALAQVPRLLNGFLGRAVSAVRARFHGKVTYASIPSERVDWSLFDIVGVDAYRSVEVADQYVDAIHSLVAPGKPVAITEFGCATFRGAADMGARGIMVVQREGATVVGLKGDLQRDENDQAIYARDLLEIFDSSGVDSAFWCVFADYSLPHRSDPRRDFDMASYGVVRVLEDGMGWEPKAVFDVIAAHYGRYS